MLHTTPLPKPKPIKVVKPRKPRRKKTNRQALEERARLLVREIVLKRDVFCVCLPPKKGHSEVMQSGHLITSGKGSIRFDLRNCNTQCSSCNQRHEHFPEIYTVWFIREFGKEAYESLVLDGEKAGKLYIEELQVLCDELTAIRARQDIDKDFKPRYSQVEILSGTWRKENERKSNNGLQNLSGNGAGLGD